MKYIVKSYVENPEIRYKDLKKEELKEEVELKTSGIDSCRLP